VGGDAAHARGAVAAAAGAASELFVVNWNLAGVNTNAFEFHLSDSPSARAGPGGF
jgi:hypothetical protein